MKAADRVIVLADPLLWGVGTIKRPTLTGHLIVGFGEGVVETFHPQELELEQRWFARKDRPLGIESEKTAA
jgi:hypothetical protein